MPCCSENMNVVPHDFLSSDSLNPVKQWQNHSFSVPGQSKHFPLAPQASFPLHASEINKKFCEVLNMFKFLCTVLEHGTKTTYSRRITYTLSYFAFYHLHVKMCICVVLIEAA